MGDLYSGVIDIDDVSNILAPKFTTTFTSLLNVMVIQEMKDTDRQMRIAAQQEQIHVSSSKRPAAESLDENASKRSRGTRRPSSPTPEPKTPDQPTVPQNPNWTGSSIESKDEENTKKLLFDVVRNTMGVLESGFRRITWQRSGYRVELFQTFVFFTNCIDCSERDNTKVRLGMETITAINDGGLGIRYNAGRGPVNWQPGGIRPVLSLEVLLCVLSLTIRLSDNGLIKKMILN